MTSTLDDEDLSMPIDTRRGSRDTRSFDLPDPAPAQGTPTIRQPPQGQPASDKIAGTRLGQYNILHKLGEGSFGKVKLATHVVTGQKVALKIMSRRKLVTRDMAGRTEREIQYLQLLRHPHIIKLYTVITTPVEIIMVLEYAGYELFDYIVQHGKMSEEKARKFFQQIVCAVEYCHRHKIVHRDLKPENLLLDEQLNVKIADFGLSNIMTDGNFLKTSCGSPNYAAPEVISGKLYAGPEVDVWSCGVILYVLLVGRLPFDDEYIPALFKKIAQGNYVVPSYLSSGAVHIIRRMLQVNPVNRITIQEIRNDSWFKKDLADYLQPPVEDFLDTGIDPNKAIDPRMLAKGKPATVQERIHQSVVGKLGKTMGYAPDDVQEALLKDEPSAIKDAYLIVRENHLMKTNPSMKEAQPEFGQSPPPMGPNSMLSSPRPRGSPRPPISPLASTDNPRHGSTGSTSIMESRSPASTVGILPSSLPDYHMAYMRGVLNKSSSPAGPHDELQSSASKERTKEEREATARHLKPHSKSAANLHRHAHDKPEPLTSIPEGRPGRKSKGLKWQFGIRSRNSPAEAMLAIYRALAKMGAQWEVPELREPGDAGSGEQSPERQDDRSRSNSPEYSDSDPGSGTDPEYATHEEQERRRARRRQNRDEEARGRERYGRWNDWGYDIPEDPWVIHARFKKEGMFAAGVPHPTSARSSQVNLTDKRASFANMSSSNMTSHTSSAAGSSENVATTGPPFSNGLNSRPGSTYSNNITSNGQAKPEESVWVYITIQLYAIEKDSYLVDFKCAGYELLLKRFRKEVTGSNESDVIEQDCAPMGYSEDDLEEDESGEQLVGAGRTQDDKEITSPFPFLDVASRLIIQLAEANE